MTEQGAKAGGRANSSEPEALNREWHWYPDLPIGFAPLLVWPPQPRKFLFWVIESYLSISDRVIYITYALLVGFLIQPVTEAQAMLSIDWTATVVLRNLAVLLVVAGGLHLWFYGIDAQGNLQKYDPRPMSARKNALFKFGYQTWDNMFYALVSGVPIASAYEIAFRWLYANGALEILSFSGSTVWSILLFPLLLLWQSLHFYFVHRLLHWKPLYKAFHSVHHRNVNPGPWSGMAMHPVEHALYFSSLLIFLVVPSHPAHMIFMLNWQFLGAPSSHSGYEAIWVKDKSRLVIGSFFLQLHHRYYECNYGGVEMPWDRWLGTFHDGSEEGTRAARDRKRRNA